MYPSFLFFNVKQKKNTIENLGKLPGNFFYKNSLGVSILEVGINYLKDDKKIIIYSHGSYTNIQYAYESIKIKSDELQIPIILYDYLGFGISEDVPNEKNCYKSLESVMEIYENYNILLVGHSLGTGVIIDYAFKHKWKNHVVLLSPFKNIFESLADITGLPLYTVIFPFDNYTKMEYLICDVSVIYGSGDEYILPKRSLELYDKCTESCLRKCSYYSVDCGHTDVLRHVPTEYFQNFLSKI